MATVYKTLDDIINQTTRYDVNKITFLAVTDDETLVIPDKNLFEIYRRYINPYIGTYKVTDGQRSYYRFRPDMLSADVYGTPELMWLILMLNDQECPTKFRLKATVRLIPADQLVSLYDAIVTKSSSKLQENWNSMIPLLHAIT